ncbi:uncharacterized protein LOC131155611 isoform X2 [Malania oleifera]|uniref:uncharacterized protein LOC131155611 isoform X2 n=1 Tax=Malania oleifera TaxID=397392 RepID=UPI0025AE9A85|nr:uncharacterized protein LOC131155611 isoform X2 [Malania oleifera]
MGYSPYHHETMWLALQSSALALQVHDEVFMSRKGGKNEQKRKCWEQLQGGVTSSKWFHLLETTDDLGFNLDAHNMGYSTKHKLDMASQCPDGGKIDHMVKETTLVTPIGVWLPPDPWVSASFFHSNSLYYAKPMMQFVKPRVGVFLEHRIAFTVVKINILVYKN